MIKTRKEWTGRETLFAREVTLPVVDAPLGPVQAGTLHGMRAGEIEKPVEGIHGEELGSGDQRQDFHITPVQVRPRNLRWSSRHHFRPLSITRNLSLYFALLFQFSLRFVAMFLKWLKDLSKSHRVIIQKLFSIIMNYCWMNAKLQIFNRFQSLKIRRVSTLGTSILKYPSVRRNY